MTYTVADLAFSLKFLGEVRNVDQTSFDIRIADPKPSRTVKIETTQKDLDERLRAIAEDHPEKAWGQGSLTAEEGAKRLLTVHLEELIDNLEDGNKAIVVSKAGIYEK